MPDGADTPRRTAPGLLRRVLLPSAIPTAVSLAVHAALAGILLTVGVRVALAPPPPPSGAGLAEISLLAPSLGGAGAEETMQREAQRVEQAREAARVAGALTAAPGLRVSPTLRGSDLPAPDGAAPPAERSLPGAGVRDEGRPEEPAAGAGARFAGLEARRGLRIAYVVDGSGAMAATMPYVVDEVARSIARLESDQQFRVFIYRATPTDAAPTTYAEGWSPASAEHKIAAARWLRSVVPGGRSTPLDGLRAALRARPDVVFMLARSIPRSGPDAEWDAGLERTLAELDRLNPLDPRLGRRRAVIKAVQFIEDDPTGLMQAIGARHGDGAASYTVLRVGEDAPATPAEDLP